MIYLEYRDGSSEKFWKLELSGSTFTVTFGKIGTAGQSQTKVFESELKAQKEADKLAAAKRKKGYADAAPPSRPAAPKNPPLVKEVKAASSPAGGPAAVADDGKTKTWHREENVFDLARLADPDGLPSDWDEYDEDDEDEDTDFAGSEGMKDNPDDPAEERFRSACRARNLQLMQDLWKKETDAGKNHSDWLAEGLALCLGSGHDAADAPLVQWLLTQGATFPGGKDDDWDDDDEDGDGDDWNDEGENSSDGAEKPLGEFYPSSGPFRSHDRFANYFYREYSRKRDPAQVPQIYGTFMDAACAHLVGQLEQIVPKYRNFVPGEKRRDRNFEGFDGLPGSTPLNKSFLGMNEDTDLPEEFWCYFLEALREHPTAARAQEAWKQYLDDAFAEAAGVFAAHMREYAACVRAGIGNDKSEKKDFAYLPEGGRIGKEFISIELGVPNEYWVYVYLRGAERENPLDFRTEKVRGLTTQYMPRYAHLLDREMKKLTLEGTFDGLFEWGGFMLKMEDSPELIGAYITDPDAPARFEARLAELEEMAERCRGGCLSGQALAQETEDMFCIFLALLHGLFGLADEERAYRLLRSFLYCCADKADEDKIVNMMYRWDDSYPRINYELALFHNENLHPDQAEACVRKALDLGYSPAADLEKVLKAEAELRNHLARKPSPDTGDGEEVSSTAGFDLQAARRAWKNTTFEQAFSEADLYMETENIVARARPNGRIYIRFLVEGEAGYGEALDFVNRLLEKGYAKLSGGWSEGFALRVRFLIKPEYISQMKNSKSKLGLSYPQNSCHAFFARAVRYPALRPRVADYAERALCRFDYYLDLTDENNTVPGTFAAVALAFCGKEYLPLVSHYADATDDEHTYLLPALMLPLVKHYGNDPDLAGAVFDIARNSNLDGGFRLPKELIWDADFMERLLEHGGAAEGDSHALEDFAIACEHIYGDKARANLKKLCGLVSTAPSRRERQIYADFFNMYLAAMCIWDSDNLRASFEPIDSDGDAGEQEEAALEHQECVITLAEAELRGYEADDTADEQMMLFIAPACLTDVETIAYVRRQMNNIGRENSKPERERSCRMLMSTGPCCIRCGSWVVNTADMPFECGVLLYDEKKNSRPVILFGELDALALGAACKKRWPKSTADAEALRRKYLIKESAPRPAGDDWMEADRFHGEDWNNGSFYSEWHSCMARRVLEGITPPFGELVYLCARLMLVYLTERRGDVKALAKLAEELMALQPEKTEYWKAKLEQVRAAQE